MTLASLAASGEIRSDYSVAELTTYKFGGPVRWFAEVSTRKQLDRVLAAKAAEPGPVPLFVLGRGSNTVISDAGFSGLMVKLTGDFVGAELVDEVVIAGGGMSLPRLARFCVAAGRGGLEWYVGIPGSVGGAVAMNAGGNGSDTAEWLVDATVLDAASGAVTVEDSHQLDLSYRHSRIGPTDVVLSARFRTIEREPVAGEQLMREITAWRKQHQPGGTFNAGSVFKNPTADAAGRIIDELGLKGYRCGGVAVSEKHGNFFVADQSACAQDVFDLVSEVRAIVAERRGVVLEPEIRFVGDFDGQL